MASTTKRSAANTIYTQSASIIISLLVGFGIIYLFSRLGNHLEIRWSDGEIYDFWEIWLYGGIAIVATLGWTLTRQFEAGLEPFDTFKQAIYFSLGCWVLFIVIMQGCILTLESNSLFAVAVIGFNFLAFATLGSSIGLIQALTVKLSRFDKHQHLNQISEIADLTACKNNILPYRQKIYIFWDIVSNLTLSLFLIGIMLFLYRAGENNLLPYILFGLVTALFLYATIFSFSVVISPEIRFTKGTFTKSTLWGRRRLYLIHTNGKTFQTDILTWDRIQPEKTYIIWFLPPVFYKNHQGRVIAYKQDISQLLKVSDEYLAPPVKKPRGKMHAPMIAGTIIGAIAIFSRFYKASKRRN